MAKALDIDEDFNQQSELKAGSRRASESGRPHAG